MDEVLCSVCRRVMTARELGDRAPARGEVICSQCLSKMRDLAPVRCHRCNAFMPPVSNGRTVFCRKCGAELGLPGAGPAAAPAPAQGVQRACPYCGTAVRPGAVRCTFCGSSLAPEAREIDVLLQANRRMSFWLGAVSAFCVLLMFAGIVLYVGNRGPFGGRRVPTPVATEEPSPTAAEPVAPLSDADILAAIERAVTPLRARLERTEADLASARNELAELSRRAATAVVATPIAAPPLPTPPATAPTDMVAELIRTIAAVPTAAVTPPLAPPSTTDQGALEARAQAFFNMARTSAQAYERDENFAMALRAWNAFPKEYKNTQWQKEVDAAKAKLMANAENVQQRKLAEAEALLKANALEDARKVLLWLSERGLPDAAASAQDKLAAVDHIIKVRDEQIRAASERRSQIVALRAQLRDAENPLRSEAAMRLGELRAGEAVPDLIAALKDPDWFLVVRAARALGAIGDRAAVSPLIEAMSNRFPAVPVAVAEALKELTGQNLGEDPEKWRSWWEANRSTPPAAVRSP